MTIQDFFSLLNEGDEYLTIMCTKDTYRKIPHELMKEIVINSIRQKNESFKDDPVHKEKVKALNKAKKDLSDYEYLKNNP